MRHFVRADIRRAVTKRRRRRARLQEGRRPVRDEPRVFHREADGERDRDLVELRERIVDAEPALLAGEQLGERARGERELRRVASLRDQPQRRGPSARAAEIDELPRADREGDQVRRQRLRRLEAHVLHAVRGVRLRRDRRVGHGDGVARHAQRDLPRGLEAGLVEARERLPRRRRLELRHRVPGAAVLQREDAAGRIAVLLGLEGEREPVRAGAQRGIERDAHELIVARQHGGARLAGVDLRARNHERPCVQPQHGVRTVEIDVDRDLAWRLRRAGNDRQRDGVARRARPLGNAQRRHFRIGGQRCLRDRTVGARRA